MRQGNWIESVHTYSSSKYCWPRWSTNVKDNRRTSSASIRHESLTSEIERSWGAIFYNILQYSTIFYNILQYSTIFYNILQYSTTIVIAIIIIVKHSFGLIPWYNFHCFIHNQNNVSQLSQWQAPSVTVVNNIPCPKHKVSSQYYHIV